MESAGQGHLALFAYYYPPLGGAGSQRALSYARHLPARGWRVTVFTPREGVYGTDASLAGEGLPGVRVVRTPNREVAALLRQWKGGGSDGTPGGKFVEDSPVGPVGATLRGLARKFLYFPDSARGWIGPAAAAAAEVHREDAFHLVLSTSPPLSGHMAAHRFAGGAGLSFVPEFRDLPLEAVSDPEGRVARLVKGLLGGAKTPVTVSPVYSRWLEAIAGPGTTRIVYNGFEPSPAPPPAGPDPAGPLEVVYAGSTYADRQDFSGFLRVMEALRGEGIPWVLRLAGKVDPATRERCAAFRTSGALVEEGFVEKARVLELQARARAVLVWAWEGGGPVGMGQVPAKLFEALPSGRPVLLVASPGSDAEAVGRILSLKSLAHGDLEGMRRRLQDLADGRIPGGMTPEAKAQEAFTREAQAARMAEVLAEAAAPAVRA